GWGLAFFQGGEVLLQRHPKPVEAPFDFYAAIQDLRTDYIIGHVREPGVEAKLENTQPYRFRSWVFAHSGTVGRFEAIQAGIVEHIPDFLRRNVRSQMGSEHVFHLFLAFLHDAGKLDDPTITLADAENALRATIAMINRLVASAGAEPGCMNTIATNGRLLLATRQGRPVWLRRTEGINDCSICRAHDLAGAAASASDRHRYNHEHLKSILIVSDPDRLGSDGWEEAPEGSVVGVNRDLAVSIHPLRIA
ncbi:MAG: class II glutamine amidotransferase, partial [Pseudomonadota bacterium]